MSKMCPLKCENCNECSECGARIRMYNLYFESCKDCLSLTQKYAEVIGYGKDLIMIL